jgi:ribosome biogenesis GTPase
VNDALTGTVVAAFGRHYDVVIPGSEQPISCVRRGKRKDVACGDRVDIQMTSPGQGVIDTVHERRTLLYRADAWREKLLAANVDQALIVIAPEPTYSDELLTRCLIAADAAGVAPVIILNKMDLGTSAMRARAALEYYVALGYPLVSLSALQDVSTLRPFLTGRVSILVGQSGMGKSTLVNALVPNALARTNIVSQALDSGRHTTTAAHYYAMDAQSALIDSPGLQEFGLAHLSPKAIEGYFREFSGLLGQCRFMDCQHLNEPDCALKNWARGNERRELRLRYLTSLQQAKRHRGHG